MHATKIINLIHHFLAKVVVNSPWPLGICTLLLQTYCVPANILGKTWSGWTHNHLGLYFSKVSSQVIDLLGVGSSPRLWALPSIKIFSKKINKFP
jgi:hypothetical protein